MSSIEQKIAEILQEEGDFVKDTEHAEPGSIKQPEVATEIINRTKKQQAKVGAKPESGEGKTKPTPGQGMAEEFDLPEEVLSMSEAELAEFMQTEEFAELDEDIKNELAAFAQTLSERQEEEEMHIDVSADVAALTNGEELTEEFKTKAATIFEAAVVTRVKAEIAKIEEHFDARLTEEVESIKEGLIDKVDGYLNYVVEQWMTDNELALEKGVKLEIMESFISGMKNVFEEHYIDVPEEKYDALADLQEQVEGMQSKLDEMLEANVGLTQQIDEMNRAAAIVEATDGLVDTDVVKFNELAEELSYDDAESFKTKLQTIKENYFGKKTPGKVSSVVTDSPVQLTEETEVSGPMAGYLRALNSRK